VTERVRVGVVGLGYIGDLHARIVATSGRAELAAVCDVDASVAQRAGAKFQAQPFTQVAEMLREAALDAVHVCLPDRLHEPTAVAVAQSGLPMLLEKPMAQDGAAVRRVAAAVNASRSRLMVGHVLRHDPRYCLLYRETDPSKAGPVVHARAARNAVGSLAARVGSSSSILFYLGVHDVDALQWLTRSAITHVVARAANISGRSDADSLFVLCEFASGGLGVLEYCWAWPEGLPAGFNQQFDIVCVNAAATLDTSRDGLSFVGSNGATSDDHYLWPEMYGAVHGCLRAEIEHFLSCVQSGESFAQDWREAASAVDVLDAIRTSMQLGTRVAVDRVFA
jgi:predicted dehydrogenase